MGETTEFRATYEYDNTGRLVKASDGATTVAYRYDARGGLVAGGPEGEPAPAAAPAAFCSSCGARAEPSDRFCLKCGAAIA